MYTFLYIKFYVVFKSELLLFNVVASALKIRI